MNFVNLTPHAIDFPRSGISLDKGTVVARVSQVFEEMGEFNGIPLYKSTFGAVENVPEPIEGTRFIVSALVRAACPGRSDLLSPARQIRDEEGRVIGCEGLEMN